MSIQTIVFSRDRAMQLDAMLRSFFLRCQDCEQRQIYMLYKASSEQHAQQYQVLKETYRQVNFVEQGDFRRDVLRIINPYPMDSFTERIFDMLSRLISVIISLERLPVRLLQSIWLRLRVKILGNLLPAPPDDSYILFLVDDNLFVGDFSVADIVQALQENPDALGFSLRLGSNTNYCYALDQPQSLPEFVLRQNGILKFDWTTSKLDFAYPLEVSSSVYRSKDILPIIAKHPFGNPNELEYQMAVSAGLFAQKMPFLLCPERSYTFCNPLNIVQTFAPNRAGVNVEYTSDRLAELFDQGYRIQVEAYDGFTPQSCHQEVPLEFYRPEMDNVK